MFSTVREYSGVLPQEANGWRVCSEGCTLRVLVRLQSCGQPSLTQSNKIMSELSITGKLQHVGAVEAVGTKGTQKRTIVIYVEGQYPKDVAFTLFGQKVALTDNLHIGQMVKVSFDVSSRQRQDKWFTYVIAWRIEDATQEQPQQQQPINNGAFPF